MAASPMVEMARPIAERCDLCGGGMEEARTAEGHVKRCIICGMEERLDDDQENNGQDLAATLSAKANGVEALVAFREATQSQTPVHVEERVDLRLRNPQPASLDWQVVAHQRLDTVLDQLNSIVDFSKEAVRIHAALTACGETVEPLPGFVIELAEYQQVSEPPVPPKRTGGRPRKAAASA